MPLDVEAVETPDASTVVFKLKWPSASFLNLCTGGRNGGGGRFALK